MTHIICEIGSNFETEADQILSIERAAMAGAGSVKFQMFNERELYGPQVTIERRSIVDVSKLSRVAQDCNLGFLCSAFSADGVRAVDPYVGAHKIASAEMCDTDILSAVRETGKPIFLSTGGHSLMEVARALDWLGNEAEDRTILMYCESAYPSNGYMPEKLGLLQREMRVPVGISDHSKEVYLTAFMARHYDAPVIEKHVNLVGATGPDAGHSLDFDEFKEFCRYIKGPNITPADIVSSNEIDMVVQHNRRMIATCEIPEGTSLTKGINFGFYRGQDENAHALSPFECKRVNGKVASRNILVNEAICEGDYV